MWSDGPARASPGLLRRRYSMPETVMRKYRLAQQRSDGDELSRSSVSPSSSPARGACAWCGSRASGRRDKDPMRKSALLRFWGRAAASPAKPCACAHCGTRSLDGSHSELRSAHRCKRNESNDDRDSPVTFDSHAHSATGPDLATSQQLNNVDRVDQSVAACNVSVCTDQSLTDSSDTFTTSIPTTKEIPGHNVQVSMSDHIDGRISERSVCAENEDSNVLPYDHPLTLETPAYDVLEIVVSETVDVCPTFLIKNGSPEKYSASTTKNVMKRDNRSRDIDLDEYVSNILVESLNSLTDQLESMNASMGNNRKLSIVEKEIKVKLQNTGVNTIVHLSPTSNNQIIFGNEELYDSDRNKNQRDTCSSNIREEICIESNNNFTSAESVRDNETAYHRPLTDHFLNATADSVNKAVLQQIQKLFQEDLQSIEPEMNSPVGPLPGVSHIEISNVDVFLDNNTASISNADTIELKTSHLNNTEMIGGVGTGNYYPEVDTNSIVPRFSAFPHTESMEVNTSSSEDAEIMGSECGSLVDSLDDPNSPRSLLLRRSYSNNKRSDLVRSAIDVLDLLPESSNQNSISPKEKGESFFIRIKDDDCGCEKENLIVADHMPETIKQRLYRRHRKRELRMECARRSRVKQVKRDLENSREAQKSKKELEKECMTVLNSLIDDVIAKIAQEEYKCMRIKERSNKMAVTKSDENLAKRNRKKDSENNKKESRKLIRNGYSQSFIVDLDKQHRKTDRLVRNKLTIPVNSPVSHDDSEPKRIYQKSEIHDGNKRIEILEILEYVNSSQSSPETTNSDENHNSMKNKKSRIPIPVSERIPRIPKTSSHKSDKNSNTRPPPTLSRERNGKSSQLIANLLLDSSDNEEVPYDIPLRRASVPCESRSRSNSLRFKNVFDIIPEEKSSLSLESTSEDAAYNRRASAPSLNPALSPENSGRRIYPDMRSYQEVRLAEMRSAGTSPMPDGYRLPSHSVAAMTSPARKSAATSPIRLKKNERHQSTQGLPTQPLQRRERGGSTDRRKPRECAKTRQEPIKVPKIHLKARSQESCGSNSFGSDVSLGKRGRERRREAACGGSARGGPARGAEADEDSSSSSSGGLLCSLAPAWLAARRRRRRAANTGEWAVTVAGSCPAALPNDVEMRLRFPDRAAHAHAHPHHHAHAQPHAHAHAARTCARAVECGAGCAERARAHEPGRLTLTVQKEASDSSILASKSVKKSGELPELETFRAVRSRSRSHVKTRPACSPPCWPPAPLARARNGLSVSGCAIVPELKPRVPTNTERDLTRTRALARMRGPVLTCAPHTSHTSIHAGRY